MRFFLFVLLLQACGPSIERVPGESIETTIIVPASVEDAVSYGVILTDGSGGFVVESKGIVSVEFWHSYLLVKLPRDTATSYVMLAQSSYGHADTVAVGQTGGGYPASLISVRSDAESLQFIDVSKVALRIQFIVVGVPQ